ATAGYQRAGALAGTGLQPYAERIQHRSGNVNPVRYRGSRRSAASYRREGEQSGAGNLSLEKFSGYLTLRILSRLYTKKSNYVEDRLSSRLAGSAYSEDSLAAARSARLRDHVCHPGYVRRRAS